MKKSRLQWIRRMHQKYGAIVGLLAALALLLFLTFVLISVMVLLGGLMLINPYLALGVGIVSIIFLIWKRV